MARRNRGNEISGGASTSRLAMLSAALSTFAVAMVIVLLALFISSRNAANSTTYVILQNQMESHSPTSGATLLNYSFPKGCVESAAQDYAKAQAYQYEGNPCHLFYINANISARNYSLDGGVDAALTVYRNILIVPMSQPAMAANSTSAEGSQYLINNRPFALPSYFAPKNWSTIWGKLATYNATTGRLIWEDSFSAPVMSQPIIVNNTIFISTGADFVNVNESLNGVYAINATTGKILWSMPVTPEMMPTPIYYNNTVVVVPGGGTGVNSQYLMGLNPWTGEPLWTVFVGGESAMSSPALVGNTIYFGVRLEPFNINIQPQRNAELAVNLDTQKVVWEDYFPSNLGTQDESPVVWNNVVVTGYAVPMLNSSNVAGPQQGAENSNLSIETQNDSVYLYGINATTGKKIWKVYQGQGVNPPRSKMDAPTVYNGVVYSDGTVVGNLFAINVTTGRVLWTFHTGFSDPNPAVVGSSIIDINQTGTIFVLSMNGTLERKVNLGLAMGWCGSGQLAVVGSSLAIGGENERLDVIPLSKILPQGTN